MSRDGVAAEYRERMAREDYEGALAVLQKDAADLGLYPDRLAVHSPDRPPTDAEIDEVITGIAGSGGPRPRSSPPSPSRPPGGG
jgi:hypothetical protein